MAVVLALAATGCLDSGISQCSDGRICALGFACDEATGACVSRTPCAELADGAACIGVGVIGVCRSGNCIPRTCGDAVVEGSETCDDGGLLSHDGCSSRCATEKGMWIVTSPTESPGPRIGHAMAYDTRRARLVLFGGSILFDDVADTWEWDGLTWIDRAPVGSPSGRSRHAMAYDAARGHVVMFGGTDVNMMLNGETWSWNGTAWTRRMTSVAPSARFGHAMAYDAARARIVLFGGSASGTFRNDTWEWDGTTWTQRTPLVSPPARHLHAMAYDAARGRVMLYGGRGSSAVTEQDTWEWDGATWIARAPLDVRVAVPSMAYDAARRRVVLFGSGGPVPGMFWEWDGTAWTAHSPDMLHPPDGHVMAYDAARRSTVVFGGLGRSPPLEMWQLRHEDAGALDETCAAGLDEDGDGLAACEDPDCWGYCTPSCPPATSCDPTGSRCDDGTCNPDLETVVCPADCS